MSVFNRIGAYFSQVSKAVGVEIVLGQSQGGFKAVVLNRTKSGLEVERTNIYDDLESLLKELPKNAAIGLCIHGEGVLVRPMHIGQELSSLLPGANASEFVFQAQTGIGAAAREKLITGWIGQFESAGFHITHYSLGPLVTTLSAQLLGREQVASYAGFSISEKEIAPNPTDVVNKLDLNGETIESNMFWAFSAALNTMSSWQAEPAAIGAGVTVSTRPYLYTKWMPIVGWSFMICLLVGLLVNYLAFDHYRQLEQQLSNQSVNQRAVLEQVKQHEAQLKQRKEVLAFLGLEDQRNLAWMADQIAQTVPSGIKLTGLQLFPLTKALERLDKTEMPEFDRQTILINGQSKKSLMTNNWIKTLSQLEWLEDVHILSVEEESDESVGSFMLELSVK